MSRVYTIAHILPASAVGGCHMMMLLFMVLANPSNFCCCDSSAEVRRTQIQQRLKKTWPFWTWLLLVGLAEIGGQHAT